MHSAQPQRLTEFRSIRSLTAFYLDNLGHKLPIAAIKKVADGRLLRFEAKTRPALSLGRNAVVSDEIGRHRGLI
jgi:hypothetical protein